MSELISNDPDSILIRRNTGTILVTGAGVAAFGIWSIIKCVMEFMLAPIDQEVIDVFAVVDTGGAVFIGSVVIFIIMTDLLLRFYIFTCARKEIGGRKAGAGFGISTFIVASGSVYSVFYMVYAMVAGDQFGLRNYVSLFVELTSLFILVELIASLYDNRKLGKKAKEDAA
ncbi:MAG: hypothetical protein J5685_09600 [Clostridiales bacterium]|nr:hypothetical protein [Clostridiales bacterium]